MRTVIGIDPGLASTGWGVVRFDGSRFLHVAHGVVTTDPETPLPQRLQHIHREITRVIADHRPQEAGVEDLYFSKNATSAIHVAHARGVVLLALGQGGLSVGTYSPQQVKQAVIGRGKAGKDQVQRLVAVVLGLEEIPGPDHAADALAVAVCHANRADWLTRAGAGRRSGGPARVAGRTHVQ
ncbi:MAG TPA: crossover junction endodeoxyribonuclease RuvC [Spirochaetia bacterium]|nr:crossover junction endodeoxyribonuclease RuvC [Spirochaetia bacterium]